MEKKEVKVKDSRMYSLIVLFDMHTDFFGKAIEGISDKDSQNRLNTKAVHPAWIAGSITQERFELANNLLDKDDKQAAYELFENHKGIQDTVKYPSLSEFKKDWDKVSPALREALSNATTEKLDTSFEMMPGAKMTYYELYSFMMYREANMIGQLALWRRLLGYEGIKYM